MCEGTPLQIGMTGGYDAKAVFLIKVKDTKPWSVFLSKERFKSACQDIGRMILFGQNWIYVEMEEETVKHFVVKSFLCSVVLTCVAFLLVSQCM